MREVSSPYACYRFGGFTLDADERQLCRGSEPVELSGRYFDALVLMVREQGRLITKDRFLDEVWSGVPVTDEALSQCIKTLRRQLGDSAAHPRFIETVPKHGYRFIAPVEIGDGGGAAGAALDGRGAALALVAAGTVGGGIAGIAGGFLYGLGGTTPAAGGMGAISVLLVLIALCILVGLAGGLGVSLGMYAPSLVSGARMRPSVVGGALGGLLVGGAVQLIGTDALNLLFGSAPAGMTGGMEGAILGGSLALGALLGSLRPGPWWRAVPWAAAGGGIGGIVVALAGGRLMGGSLELVSNAFASSRLQLDSMGALFGEPRFGPLTETVLSGIEGSVFAAGVAAGIAFASRRWLAEPETPAPADAPAAAAPQG